MISIEVLVMLFMALGYDAALTKCREGTVATACTVVDMINSDWMVFFGTSAFSGVILAMNWKMWL